MSGVSRCSPQITIPSGRAWKQWPSEQLRLELSAFTRWSERRADPARWLLSREEARNLHAEVRHLYNELRDGGSDRVIEVNGWRAEIRRNPATGRLEVSPQLLAMSSRDAFFWHLADTLGAATLRTALCPTCRNPFVARKAQRYCTAGCAPSGAERNRAYRQRHRDRLNLTRRHRYDAGRRKQFAKSVFIKARTPR
jgi:hypothetical protein